MTGSYMTQVKFTVGVQQGWNDLVVNLPVALTIQERKMHRACMDYTINGGYIFDTNQNVKVKLGGAPRSWPVVAALKRGRNLWLEMHRELFKNNPSLKPKWHDFKPALTQGQKNGNVVTYNVPEDIFDDDLEYEEAGITWSIFVSEDGQGNPTSSGNDGGAITDKDEFTAHLLGEHTGSNFGGSAQQYDSIGLLHSWMNSRPDLDPINTISSTEDDRISNDPLQLLFNDGDADNEIIQNFTNADINDGDQEGDRYPMYHLLRPFGSAEKENNNPGGKYNIQEFAAAYTTSSSPVSYFTGFKAMLGQVYVRIYSASAANGTVDIMFDVDPRGASI